MKGIGHFLSTGIRGKIEGECFKKTPDLGDKAAALMEYVPAGGEKIIFKPLSAFTAENPPEVVIFFGNADVMGALIVMANYARETNDNVVVQFSSGCYSIITEPEKQRSLKIPKAVLGSFDIACRLYLDTSIMTFALPTDMLWELARDMEESFLITKPWQKIRGRPQERSRR